MRKLTGPSHYTVYVVGIFVSLFSLYTAAMGVMAPFIQRGIHVGCLLPLAFLLYPATKKSPKDRITIFDAFWSLAAFIPCVYVVVNRNLLEGRMIFVSKLTTVQIVLGLMLILAMLEAIRRAVTPVMTILAVIGLTYLYAGSYLSGIFYHKGLPFSKLVEANALLTGEGIFGSLMGTSATFIIVFVIFGSFAVETGAGEFFIDFARAIAGQSRGGSAKIATISAGLFGTMTGSAVATVYTTGTFTVPLMKRGGFSDTFAGAVAAVASTGGQIMPPIMGAAAFLMAENLGIPYGQVAIKSAIVAVLYYFSLFAMIHCKCMREDIRGEKKEDLPKMKDVMKRCYLFLPIILLLVLLLSGTSTLKSGLIATIACIAVSFFNKKTMMTPQKFFNALYSAAKGSIMVCAALGGAGIIVVAVTYSGLALSFSSLVISLSGGIKFVALLLIAVSCMILGMGVPSTAAYVISAALGTRILIRLGVEPFAAHMFVFYFSIISNITPPVAVAAYAAANVAKSNPMKTGVTASILAVVGYVVPFMAAYNPALLLEGPVQVIIQATITAFIGVYLLSAAIQGWFMGAANIPMRILLGATGLLLTAPGTKTDLIAIVLIAACIFLRKFIFKTGTVPAA